MTFGVKLAAAVGFQPLPSVHVQPAARYQVAQLVYHEIACPCELERIVGALQMKKPRPRSSYPSGPSLRTALVVIINRPDAKSRPPAWDWFRPCRLWRHELAPSGLADILEGNFPI